MKRFLKDSDGATAIEYALILAVVVLIALTGMLALGTANTKSYNDTAQKVGAALK